MTENSNNNNSDTTTNINNSKPKSFENVMEITKQLVERLTTQNDQKIRSLHNHKKNKEDNNSSNSTNNNSNIVDKKKNQYIDTKYITILSCRC
ncbi:hypothetical protein PPL_06398 [Heterostelium album PN500]|uniref:Uncharacterized protein n=1 Tax=Heterostelium pallidum (strain ATCC 26659 / Pp 5 / PN500) TaxID=670386 RepID=D3BD18_HETP5|nr:hypothetical protein PPL_06398 [Heterostelium album PN500]EFA80810.1 hypothetical protein PPL_06398 [Heterostelium album PN500]|eukprot:XP_020432929.1 hypothetical protein PPL_06398 [Heterostelium album PN500]